jgi:hypothetical protein
MAVEEYLNHMGDPLGYTPIAPNSARVTAAMVRSSNLETPPASIKELSTEISALVERRRALFVFLGSTYGIMSVFLENLLAGKIPQSFMLLDLDPIVLHLLILTAFSLLMAFRLAHIHYGMVTQGIEFAVFEGRRVARSKKLNWFGVSAQHFLLCVAVTSLSFGGLMGTLLKSQPAAWVSAAVCAFVLYLYFRYICHKTAEKRTIERTKNWKLPPPDRNELRDHAMKTMQDAQLDMVAITANAGLLVFSLLQTAAVLEEAPNLGPDRTATGLMLYTLGVVLASVSSVIMYIRLRLAIFDSYHVLNPSDTEFQACRLLDSALGYVMLTVISVIGWSVFFPTWSSLISDDFDPAQNKLVLIIADVVAFLLYLFPYAAIAAWPRRNA